MSVSIGNLLQSEVCHYEYTLPIESGKYIVCNKSGVVFQAKYYTYPTENGGHWGLKDKGSRITHWMPLPEAPKSESEFDSIPVEAAQALKEKAVEKAKAEVAREIFEEIELFLNKAIDGWRKEGSFACDSRKIEMIDFRIGAFKYCLYKIAELKKKYTEEKG